MSKVFIEKRGKRIVVRSAQPLPGLKTKIPGSYQSVYGYWTVPCDLEVCTLLREQYGRSLVIGNELYRWAKSAKNSREYMHQLSKLDRADLEVLPDKYPKLTKAMESRPYQLVGVRYVADSHPGALIADDPGLGKTLIALGGVIESEIPGPYLVVAPKTATFSVWHKEIRRWLPDHKPVVLPEGRDARERTLNRVKWTPKTWLIVHPEAVLTQSWWECQKCHTLTQWKVNTPNLLDCEHAKTRHTKRTNFHQFPAIFEQDWGVIIVDESHDSLIRRGRMPTQRRLGLEILRDTMRVEGKRLALSGTPYNSKPYHLWGTLNWLDPKTHSGFNRWVDLYWERDPRNKFKIGDMRKEREPLLWNSLNGIALRRTKLEVAQDLPPKQYMGTLLDPSEEDTPVGVWLPMDGKQATAYEHMLEHSIAELDSGRLEAVTALTELIRLKQLACSYGDIDEIVNVAGEIKFKFRPTLPSNKYQWLTEFLEELGVPYNPTGKVMVVSQFTSLLTVVSQKLEHHFRRKNKRPITCMITGRIKSNRERSRIIQRFNEDDDTLIMLVNTKAGGTSITVDSADDMVFLSETRIPDQQKQAEDRIHRVSNPRPCRYWYLRSEGTVDVGTALINHELDKESHRLLDGRRGVEYLREVIELSQ